MTQGKIWRKTKLNEYPGKDKHTKGERDTEDFGKIFLTAPLCNISQSSCRYFGLSGCVSKQPNHRLLYQLTDCTPPLNTHMCLFTLYSWITYQKTPLSTSCRHPSPLPRLFPRGPRARGRRLWLLPWPLHRSTLKSAWNRRNYRYKPALFLLLMGWVHINVKTCWFVFFALFHQVWSVRLADLSYEP